MTTGEFGEKTFTTFEVARLCGVFHTTVINWVNKGKLKARVTPGGHRRIPLSELIVFMKKYDMPIPANIEDQHKQVLILDDEPMMTRLLEKGFAKYKDRYAVQVANNPIDALVIVGKKLSASQQDFLTKNCDRFLQKPFDMSDLVGEIDKLLN